MRLPSGTFWGPGVNQFVCYTCGYKTTPTRIFINDQSHAYPMCEEHYNYWLHYDKTRVWRRMCEVY